MERRPFEKWIVSGVTSRLVAFRDLLPGIHRRSNLRTVARTVARATIVPAMVLVVAPSTGGRV